MSSSEEDTNISASTTDKGKKNIGGRPYGPVWEYFTKGEKNSLNSSEKNESNKKRKSITQEKLDQYISITELDQQKIKRIHIAWARAFAICGISWYIVENPFFIEALKETNLSYKPPTRQYLSDHLLEQQLAIINQKTSNILQQYSNLTL
ncbi:4144_t:CDS:2, partial [Gigaspora margarita]